MFSLFKKLSAALSGSSDDRQETEQNDHASSHPQIQSALSAFAFLQKGFGFELIENSFRHNTAQILYAKGERQVYIRLNFADAKLIFALLIGKDTQYKTHLDTEYVKDFYWLFKRHVPDLDWKQLHPENIEQWREAIEKNAALLRQYGEDILTGEKWSGKDSFQIDNKV